MSVGVPEKLPIDLAYTRRRRFGLWTLALVLGVVTGPVIALIGWSGLLPVVALAAGLGASWSP
jgi:hypothetical protein